MTLTPLQRRALIALAALLLTAMGVEEAWWRWNAPPPYDFAAVEARYRARLDSIRAARQASLETAARPAGNLPGGTDSATPRIDINRADAAALTALPGIGPGKAARIVAWREKNGPFRMTRELLKIRGIGPATLEKLAPLVTVGGG